MDRAPAGPPNQGGLNPTMLVAKRNLKVKDAFPVALKAKVAGLDDSSMHGTDRNLMDFIAIYFEKLSHPGERGLSGGRSVGRMEANWLEPRMTLRLDFPLLRNFALEPMRLLTLHSQARVGSVHFAPKRAKGSGHRVGQYSE
jgi:hypothetical protein